MKQIAMSDFLTDEQIEAVVKLWLYEHRHNFHKRVVEEIIKPNLDVINRKLGQENDANFLAYAIEFAMSNVKP